MAAYVPGDKGKPEQGLLRLALLAWRIYTTMVAKGA